MVFALGSNKLKVETGYFNEGLPYLKIGDKPDILVSIEALSFKHEVPTRMMAKMTINSMKVFTDEYTVYVIGRKPNLPDNYLFDKIAADYAQVFRRVFKKPVDLIGVSTGGQIIQYIAADHPDVVRKIVLISTAYRLSEAGVKSEAKSGEYFLKKKYGKAMASIIEDVYKPGFTLSFMQVFLRMFGRFIIGKVKYPNDYMVEIIADREMNFLNQLHEIKAPTLILSGEDDIPYTAEDVKKTAEGIPNARLKFYKGFGHNLSISNSNQVNSDAKAFLLEK